MTHTADDELDKLLLEARTDEYGDSGNYYKSKLKRLIQAHTAAKALEAQTTGVAFAISVIDELHIGIASSDTTDRLLKGIKNQIRDRYKAETGVDPAPDYPVEVELTNYSNNSNSSTNTEDR